MYRQTDYADSTFFGSENANPLPAFPEAAPNDIAGHNQVPLEGNGIENYRFETPFQYSTDGWDFATNQPGPNFTNAPGGSSDTGLGNFGISPDDGLAMREGPNPAVSLQFDHLWFMFYHDFQPGYAPRQAPMPGAADNGRQVYLGQQANRQSSVMASETDVGSISGFSQPDSEYLHTFCRHSRLRI